MKAILGTVAFGALLGGCATTVEMGPGYYHYDTRAANAPAVVYREPAVVYHEPAVVYSGPLYSEPHVVYGDSGVVYYEPTIVYRSSLGTAFADHGS